METKNLWHFLDGLITKSTYPVCFSGDNECTLNRWLVKSERTYQEECNSSDPELVPEGELILQEDMCSFPKQNLERNWRYYISDLKNYVYTYNAPQTIFSQEEEKNIYCVSGVYCTEEQDMLVYCGMTLPAPIKIWINGRLVFINHDNYAVKKAYARYKFNKGKNIVLVERTIKPGDVIPSKGTVGFCVKLKPYKQLLEHASKIAFFNESLLGELENSYRIVPHKLFFTTEDDISLIVIPKCFAGNNEEKIRVSLLNSRDKEILSVNTVTSENLTVKLGDKVYGIVKIKVIGLEKGKESSFNVFRGDFNNECDRMIRQAVDRPDFSGGIMKIMKSVLKMNCYSMPVDYRLLEYKLLKYLEFERYLSGPVTEIKKNIFDVFKSGVLELESTGVGDSGITYGIYLPRPLIHGKDYPLVIYMLNRADGSIYPECPDFILNGEFNDAVAVCIGGIRGIQNNYADNLSISSIISDISMSLNINKEKIYLIGARDGAQSINLLLRMPDRFAAVATFNGVKGMETCKLDALLYKNASNTMFYQICSIDNYGVNGIKALSMLENMKRSKYWLLKGFQEDELFDMFNSEKLLKELVKEKRCTYPRRIEYNTSEPIYNRSFWVKIDYIDDLSHIAGIKAEIKDNQQIDVSTSNIQCFSLFIDREAMKLENSIEININKTKFSLCTGNYAKIDFNLDALSHGFKTLELSRHEFDREYLSIDDKRSKLGIKEVFLDKYLIIRPDNRGKRKNIFAGKLVNTLKDLQNRTDNCSVCSIAVEGETSNQVLSSSNFIYVVDCNEINHFFREELKNIELEFDNISIKFRNNKFWGEFFALLKCKNPYNSDKIMLLCIYNSENAAEELEGFLKTFNRIALFYSEAIISNNGNYYSYR